jgi:hypothetical protein
LSRETPYDFGREQGKIMEKKMNQKSGFVVLILTVISLSILGCTQQAPPPAQTPPASQPQMPAPAVQTQIPAPAAPAQTSSSVVSSQMPAPAGTVPMTQPGAPSQDLSRIQVGMTPEQVYQIMGPPGQLYQQGFIEWKYPSSPQGKVDIRFQNNKVILIEKYTKQ